MTSLKKTKHTLISAATLMLLGATACGPAQLGIVMSEGHGFKGGEPVLLKGVNIGHVKSIAIEEGKPTLITEIERDAFKQLKAGLEVEIKTPTLGMGSREVIIANTGSGGELSSGARVAGKTTAEALMKSAGDLANEAMKAAKEAADKIKADAEKLKQESTQPSKPSPSKAQPSTQPTK